MRKLRPRKQVVLTFKPSRLPVTAQTWMAETPKKSQDPPGWTRASAGDTERVERPAWGRPHQARRERGLAPSTFASHPSMLLKHQSFEGRLIVHLPAKVAGGALWQEMKVGVG